MDGCETTKPRLDCVHLANRLRSLQEITKDSNSSKASVGTHNDQIEFSRRISTVSCRARALESRIGPINAIH